MQRQQAYTEAALPMGGAYLIVGPSWLPVLFLGLLVSRENNSLK